MQKRLLACQSNAERRNQPQSRKVNSLYRSAERGRARGQMGLYNYIRNISILIIFNISYPISRKNKNNFFWRPKYSGFFSLQFNNYIINGVPFFQFSMDPQRLPARLFLYNFNGNVSESISFDSALQSSCNYISL